MSSSDTSVWLVLGVKLTSLVNDVLPFSRMTKSIKRTFGEYVSSIKWNNIINDLLLLKACIHNMFVDKKAV
jgi:hypothetical protein